MTKLPASPTPSADPARPPPSAPASISSLRQRAIQVHNELRGILRELLLHKKVPPNHAHRLRLAIETELSPGEDDAAEAAEFAERLIARMQLLAQEVSVGDQPFPPGKVRCFWCASFECAHAEPPEPRAVFKEFSPTGQPIWLELGSLALERQHPRVDQFYRERPPPITLLDTGSALSSEQLSVYGKRSNVYRVLGQLVVGYVPYHRGDFGRSRQALTIQAVETRVGRARYHLNVLGVLPDGRPVAPFLEEFMDSRLADALASARGKLAELSFENGGAALENNIGRIYRQANRRTQHAQTRHRDRERPTSTAHRDALRASPEAFFRDVEERTWVVVGPRNRVHVFNDQGRHVTSVVYPGETIRKRTTQGKWRAGDAEALAAFRDRLSKL